jgi:hypothetical protein
MRTPKTSIKREHDLLAPVSGFARRKGYRFLHTELPFFEYRIDLYGFSRPTGETIAIELKMTDWRRALYQSLIYQLCSDYVYIAVPLMNARRVDLSTLEAYGVGLIVIDESLRCHIDLEARKSAEVREYYREPYMELLGSA